MTQTHEAIEPPRRASYADIVRSSGSPTDAIVLAQITRGAKSWDHVDSENSRKTALDRKGDPNYNGKEHYQKPGREKEG